MTITYDTVYLEEKGSCIHEAYPYGCRKHVVQCKCGWSSPQMRCGNNAYVRAVIREHSDTCKEGHRPTDEMENAHI